MNHPERRVLLSDRDREQIHVPGAIQPHGSLLAVNAREQIVAWSEDLESEVLALSERVPTLEDLLGVDAAARLRPLIAEAASRPIVPIPLPAAGRNALVHCNSQGLAVIELEALEFTDEQLAGVLRQTQETTQRLTRIQDTGSLCEALATAIRGLTGFDRVMVHRFAEDWHTWVVAEDRAPDTDSLLGLHFPASDIPAPARALYERNPVRLIADVAAAPVPLRARDDGPDPLELDLGDTVLQCVSPTHIQYLENMGVGSSMSIALLRGGRLWGMVACHHRTAHHVPFEVRQASELLSQFVSSQIELEDELERSRERSRMRGVLAHLAEHLVPEAGFDASLTARVNDLRSMVRCDALVVSTEERILVDGASGEHDAVESWLRGLPVPEDAPWAVHELSGAAAPPLEPPMAGALVVRAKGDVRITVAWLRRERLRKVRWAGDPNEAMVRGSDGLDRLHPRQSFAPWVQEEGGTAEPWFDEDIDAARELRTLILSPAIRTAFTLQATAKAMAVLNAALARSNEELERFAYVASHDLRAPLRAVTNIVEWLNEDERDRLSEQAHEYLDLLASRVQRMDRMMVDLLAYARAGREKPRVESVDLHELVEEIAETISKPIGMAIVPRELPTVRASHVPLRQILLNLISNAVKHHDRSTGHVFVDAVAEGHQLVLSVEDDGPGIPPEHRERVFDMFTTLESRDVREGSGIGLSLVRRYARSLGGDAHVETRETRGTRVIVRLGIEGEHE